MVGQVHELVQNLRLAHVCGQRAQLFVGGQRASPRSFPQLPLGENFGFSCELDRPLALGAACTQSMFRLECNLMARMWQSSTCMALATPNVTFMKLEALTRQELCGHALHRACSPHNDMWAR